MKFNLTTIIFLVIIIIVSGKWISEIGENRRLQSVIEEQKKNFFYCTVISLEDVDSGEKIDEHLGLKVTQPGPDLMQSTIHKGIVILAGNARREFDVEVGSRKTEKLEPFRITRDTPSQIVLKARKIQNKSEQDNPITRP